MKQFVRGRQAAEPTATSTPLRGGLDDLKIKVSSSPFDQSPRYITRPDSGNGRLAVASHAAEGVFQPQPNFRPSSTTPKDSRPFYDTDTDSIDNTSTTSKFKPENGHPEQAGNTESGLLELPTKSSVDHSIEAVDAYDGDKVPEIKPSTRPFYDEYLANQFQKYQKEYHTHVRGLPFIKGDSYPTTTSGRESEPNFSSAHEDDSTGINDEPRAYPQLRRDDYDQELYRHESNGPNAQHPKPSGFANGVKRPSQPTHEPKLLPQGYDQSFVSAPVLPSNPRPTMIRGGSAHNRSSHITSQTINSPDKVQGVYQPRVVNVARSGRSPFQAQRPTLIEDAALRAKSPVVSREDPETPTRSARVPSVPPTNEHDNEATGILNSASVVAELLDYPPEQLHHMGFPDLKNASFDTDPNAHPFELEDAIDLQTKLEIVSSMQTEDQAKFFASLTIEEWEDAGDWFLGRFSDLVGSMRTARRQKRAAARSFEREIEDRHTAVAKKRRQMDVALKEMRDSGGKILQRTPRKVREGC